MSGDLEDFLKRAAERRQAKAVEKKPPRKSAPPQYSDRGSERVPRVPPANEIQEATIVAELATDVASSRQAAEKKPVREVQARQQAIPVIAKAAAPEPEPPRPYERASAETNRQAVGFSAEDLIMLLNQPGGVQQAILLREIFDRPEHRW